jgi:hypothetical protein
VQDNNIENNTDSQTEISPEKGDINSDAQNSTTEEYPDSFKNKLDDINKSNSKTSGLSIASLIFAFVLPPLGLIMSMVARAKAKNSNSPTKVATIALTISLILFLGLLGAGGYLIYRNYNRTLDAQDNAKSNDQSSATSPDQYTPDQKKTIEISEKFLNSIKSENYGDAFKLLSPDLQKEYINGESDFAKEVTTANLKLIDSWTVTEVTANGKADRITVKGKANFRGPTPSGNFEFAFYKDADGSMKMYLWQISPNT